jgi:hypothetical protein
MNHRRAALISLSLACILSVPGLHAQAPQAGWSNTVVNITSNPPNAEVYLDSVLEGHTPTSLLMRNDRRHLIAVRLPEYVTFYTWVSRQSRDTLNVTARLTPNWAWLRIRGFPGTVSVAIDTGDTTAPPGALVRVSVGGHTLHFEDAGSDRYIDRHVDLQPGDTVCVTARLGIPSLYPLVTSVLIPGSGQFYDRSPARGAAFLVGIAASLYFMSQAWGDYDKAQSDYQNTLTAYRLATDEAQALNLRNETLNRLDRSNSLARKRNVIVVIAAAIYAANIIDAYLFHQKDDTIEFSRKCKGEPLSLDISQDIRGVHAGLSITF